MSTIEYFGSRLAATSESRAELAELGLDREAQDRIYRSLAEVGERLAELDAEDERRAAQHVEQVPLPGRHD